MYLAAIQQFLAKNNLHNPATVFLNSMDSDTLNALASTANRQLAAFPAGGTAYTFRNYLFGITRYKDLPPDDQTLIAKYFGFWKAESHKQIKQIEKHLHLKIKKTGGGQRAQQENNSLQFAHDDFGFYTQDGQLYLAQVTPNNSSVWWPDNSVAQRKFLPGYDINDDDTDPRVVKLLPRAHFDLAEPLPARLSRPSLVLKTSQYLPHLMQQLYHGTGAAVICTRFVNSLDTRIRGLWTFEDKFPLTEAVRELDRAFGYHSAWFGGMLVSRTTDPGTNILNEPPAGLAGRMAKFALGKGPMSLADVKILGGLTHNQWTNLWWHAVAEKAFHRSGYVIGPNWRAPFMKLFASLSNTQLAAAESQAGLPAKLLTPAQRLQLILATDMGPLPIHPAPEPQNLQQGLYLRIQGTPASVKSIQFTAAYPYLGKLRVTPWKFAAKMGQNYLSAAGG